MENITGKRSDPVRKIINIAQKTRQHCHSAGKHDRGPLFFTSFSFRLIRSRSTGSI